MFRKILGLTLIIASGICLYYAIQQYNVYDEGKQEYITIEKEYTETIPYTSNQNPIMDFKIDWDTLKNSNSDVVGWIKMNPSVSYPIVKGTDNSYYLTHGFERTYNINGAIFMHCDNEPDFSDSNTIIYGHNMINGEMFGNNAKYHNKKYAEQFPYIYIYTPNGCFTYKIFDVITTPDGTEPFNINVNDKTEFEKYLRICMNLKEYGLNENISTDDKIITLSTCTAYGDQRFLIQAVMISFLDSNGNEYSDDEWRNMFLEEAEILQ